MAGLLGCLCWRWTHGATEFLATDYTDEADLIRHFDRQSRCDGPGAGRALADGGEGWVWNVDVAHVKSLVHACERCYDRGFLSDTRCAECADSSASSRNWREG